MIDFLRKNEYVSYILLILRLYVGYEWMTAGWGKLTGAEAFSAAGFLQKAISKPVVSHDEIVYPTFTAFLKGFALPNVDIFNFIIPWGEFLVGLGLVLGCLTTAAAFFGLLMNFMFMFAGTVSSNPWLVLLGMIIFVAGSNAGKYGLDRWVLPLLYKKFLILNINKLDNE